VQQPRLRDQAYSVDTGAEQVSALAFHTFHWALATADARGYVRVTQYVDSAPKNCFHVATGQGPGDPIRPPPASVTFLKQLNETDSNMLLACAADGAVRIWRSYTRSGAQRMATAWQAVPVNQPLLPVNTPSVFEWSAPLCSLFAAGGSHPSVVHRWDAQCELCIQQIPIGAGGSSTGGSGRQQGEPHVQALALAQSDSNQLLTSCSDGLLRLFDVRTSGAASCTISSGRGALAGLVFEPNGRSGSIVVGTSIGGWLPGVRHHACKQPAPQSVCLPVTLSC
jgi:WD40 repeat protein